MKKTMFSMLTENFLGGIFGASASVPWEGPEAPQEATPKFQITTNTDGSEAYVVGGGVLTAVAPNAEANAKATSTKILTYRNMQYFTEVDEAIEHVVNDVITSESGISPISINLDRIDTSDQVKEKIRDAFERILEMMDINDNGYEILRQFYVDGRRGYQIIPKKGGKGIEKMVCLDSMCIRPVKLIELENRDNIEYIKSEKSAYLYHSATQTQNGATSWVLSANQNRILELDFESVAYSDSGLFSPDGKTVVGFLEPAVKPANNLRTVEDATVIYAITRAIDKRAFYLDVGDLPKKSAEEYMTAQMNRFKTKLNYNSTTGDIDQNKVNISMVEDLWLPRRDGVSATEISTLEAGKNLGEINHVQYMKEKLYASLKIPKGRLSSDSMINIGGSELAQITRDEWKFSRHINRIRKRFAGLFKQPLKIELIGTGVVTASEWDDLVEKISFDFEGDSYIKEQQENEILMGRVNVLREIEPYVGKIWSIETVKKRILRMTDEEIEAEEKLIEKETKDGAYEDIGESPLKLFIAQPDEFGSPPDEGDSKSPSVDEYLGGEQEEQ